VPIASQSRIKKKKTSQEGHYHMELVGFPNLSVFICGAERASLCDYPFLKHITKSGGRGHYVLSALEEEIIQLLELPLMDILCHILLCTAK
jgi:hypothetical protein